MGVRQINRSTFQTELPKDDTGTIFEIQTRQALVDGWSRVFLERCAAWEIRVDPRERAVLKR